MTSPPPLPNRDVQHLRTLAIFHYVEGGLSIAGTALVFLQYFVFKMFFSDPKMWENAKNPPPFKMEDFFAVIVWVCVLMGIFLLTTGVCNILVGRFLQKRTHRTFSLVVAGLNCIRMPLGTLLGIFTIMALTRDSVLRLYDESAATVVSPTWP